VKLVYLVVFIIKKFVTVHGYMNVKFSHRYVVRPFLCSVYSVIH